MKLNGQWGCAGVRCVLDDAGLQAAMGQNTTAPFMQPVAQPANASSAGPSTEGEAGATAPNWTPELVLTGAHQTAMLADFYIQGYREGLAAGCGAQTLVPPNHESLRQLCNTLMRTRGVASQVEAATRAQQSDTPPLDPSHTPLPMAAAAGQPDVLPSKPGADSIPTHTPATSDGAQNNHGPSTTAPAA